MAENSYQARGPENRTTLITVRVTADDRDLLQRLAGERGETVSRMLLAPWLGAAGRKPPMVAKRPNERVRKRVVVAQADRPPVSAPPEPVPAVEVDQVPATSTEVCEPEAVEPAPTAGSDETPIPSAPAAKRLRRPRVNPDQEALLLGDPRVER